jgi:predicted 3-demethylubiquinone-9 3-methyltransferase (glyoxalase superfamily)
VISKDPVTKTIQFSEFSISDRTFVLMEGPGNHAFEFNEAFSFVLACDSQSEMDLYWKKLSKDGQEGQGGWLKDKFGVSWQIVLSGGNWE